MKLIIDCPYVCHKVRHGMKGVELTSESMHVEVIFGFLKQLLMICKRFQNVDDYIFCWDSQKYGRRKIYPEYKVKRAQMKKERTPQEKEFDEITLDQFGTIRRELLPMMGFVNNFIQTKRESDDVIASIIKGNPNMEFMLITSDQDLYQLLRHNVRIYSLHTRQIMYFEKFVEIYGIFPSKWAMAKAIGGCDTDEVQGIKGIADPAKSKKSLALAYLRGELKSTTKAYQRIHSDEGQKIIKRNLRLVHLPYERTNEFEIKKKSLWRSDFVKAFEKFEFYSFLKEGAFREWEVIMGLN